MQTRSALVLFGLIASLVLALAGPVAAQQTQKRSEVELMPVGPPPEELEPQPWGLYDTHVTLELGGQFASIRGNNEVYRSHLNYSDGFRVFAFDFRGKGRDGAFLTDFYAQGAGWGGDPQNWIRWGLSKDKWFDFRSHYRRNDYFWVFPGFARDQHRNDQERRLQSYDLTILPNRPVRFRLGYTRNSSFGLAFTTLDFSRDEFLLFEPLRQTYDEYRGGVEWKLRRWNVFFEQSYRFFRNDRFTFSPGDLNPGNSLSNPASFTDAERFNPIRGSIPFTRLTISGRPHNTLDVTGRLVYSDIDIDTTRFENIVGRDRFNAPIQEIFSTVVDADRPYTVVDGAVTWRPIRKLTISNHLRFDQYNISGSGVFGTFEFFPVAGTSSEDVVFDQRLLLLEGWRNRLEGKYDFTNWLGVRAGFTYEHRDVDLVELALECAPSGTFAVPSQCTSIVAVDEDESEAFTVINRSFLLGFQLRPQRTLTVFFDLERGNHKGVFTRTSPANIDRIRVRGRFEPWKGIKFNGSWFIFDNSNFNLPIPNPNAPPATLPGRHSVRNRGFSFDFQLTRFQRGYLNLGYSRNDVTAFTNVNYVNPAPRVGISLFIANDNYAYIDFGGRIAGNLYGDAGYRVVFDAGTFPPSNPLGTCNPFVPGACDDTALVPLAVLRGGLNYHQPHAALRYAFSDTWSWKAGWRWYGYNQKVGTLSDYKAHIVTTSLVLSF